jgi:2-isopropylmalate synthase
LVIKEYSEHSIGEGSEVKAASYVELVYDLGGRKKSSAWGIGIDTDITASGLKAVLNAASRLNVTLKEV